MIIRKRNEIQLVEDALPVVGNPGQSTWGSEQGSDSIDIGSFLGVLRRRAWLIAAIFAVVFGAGMVYTIIQPPLYESTARILVVTNKTAPPISTEGGMSLISDLQALRNSGSIETQLDILSSPDILRDAAKSLPPPLLQAGFRSQHVPDWACKVFSRKETDVIEVTGRAYTAAAAAAVSDAVIETYFDSDLQRNRQATRQAREYAENEMTKSQGDLSTANKDLARFKTATGLFAPETQLTASAEQLAQLRTQVNAAQSDVAAAQRQMDALRAQLQAQRQTVVSSTTVTGNPEYSAVLDKIDTLNSERAAQLQEFTPQSHEVKTLDNRIAEEQAKLTGIARTIVGSQVNARNPVRESAATRYIDTVASYSASTARLQALQRQLASGKRAVLGLPEYERQLNERTQKVAILEKRYETLSSSYHALVLGEQAIMPNAMLLSHPSLPRAPSYPNKKANALFFLMIGLVVAVPLAVVIDRMDSRLHDQDMVEQVTGLPSLSVVPRTSRDSIHFLGTETSYGPLVESYRILRNNMFLSGGMEGLKIIAVTSPGRGEGKSTTSVNLAATMAMEGKRVLLVDADLRRPSLHKLLGISGEIGLTSVISGSAAMVDAIVETKAANVYCMPSGPVVPCPSETLSSEAGRRTFRTMAQDYDVLIVDCPPCTGLGDVQVISTLADAMLLVVAMHQSLKPQLDITVKMLTRMNAPLAGVVMNRVNLKSRDYCYYYPSGEYSTMDVE